MDYKEVGWEGGLRGCVTREWDKWGWDKRGGMRGRWGGRVTRGCVKTERYGGGIRGGGIRGRFDDPS